MGHIRKHRHQEDTGISLRRVGSLAETRCPSRRSIFSEMEDYFSVGIAGCSYSLDGPFPLNLGLAPSRDMDDVKDALARYYEASVTHILGQLGWHASSIADTFYPRYDIVHLQAISMTDKDSLYTMPALMLAPYTARCLVPWRSWRGRQVPLHWQGAHPAPTYTNMDTRGT